MMMQRALFSRTLRRIAGERGVLGSLSGSLALKISNAALAMLVSISLARKLGPEGYGHYAFAMSAVALAMVPVHLGIPGLMVREIARSAHQQQWSRVRGAIRAGWSAVFLLSLVTCAALWGFYALSLPESGARASSLRWALLLVPLTGTNQVRQAILSGFRRVVAAQIPELAIVPLAMVALVNLPATAPIDATAAIRLQLLATSVALLVGLGALRVAAPPTVISGRREYAVKPWLQSLLPFSLIVGLGAVKGQTDLFLLGLLLDPTHTGLYRVALSAAGLVTFVQSAFNAALAPRIAVLHEAGDLGGMERLAQLSSRLVVAAGLPVAGAFVIGGRWVIELLYGTEFVTSAILVIILCVGQLVNGAVGSVSLILNMSGFERLTLRINILIACSGVLLTVLLVPRWGTVGAAVASSFTNVLSSLVLLSQVRRHVKVNPAIL